MDDGIAGQVDLLGRPDERLRRLACPRSCKIDRHEQARHLQLQSVGPAEKLIDDHSIELRLLGPFGPDCVFGGDLRCSRVAHVS